jgi:hypothetical protein
MNFLTQDEFLQYFEKRKSKTFTQFANTAKVKTHKYLIPLQEYIKDKDINKEDIKILFDNIQKREDYLIRFYKKSLLINPNGFSIYPKSPMKNKHMNNNTEPNFKNIIRNLHWKDILKNTKPGIENIRTYMDVLEDLYLNDIIDYKILTPSSLHYMKEGRLGSVFSSYYFRASIMNPYLVYSLNQSVLNGTKIFTPTLGWCSYLGFLECPDVVEYVGTDVIPSVCNKTKKFCDTYYKKKQTDIYCEPSEKLLLNQAFMRKYQNHFDVVFFSPPYYKLEKYPGRNQSIVQYKTYEEWLEKYWEATIQLCHRVLQKGGRMCYILSGYGQGSSSSTTRQSLGSENTKEQYDLITDMNKITRKYFEQRSMQPMYNKDVHVTEHKETNEKIMIFTKGT